MKGGVTREGYFLSILTLVGLVMVFYKLVESSCTRAFFSQVSEYIALSHSEISLVDQQNSSSLRVASLSMHGDYGRHILKRVDSLPFKLTIYSQKPCARNPVVNYNTLPFPDV